MSIREDNYYEMVPRYLRDISKSLAEIQKTLAILAEKEQNSQLPADRKSGACG